MKKMRGLVLMFLISLSLFGLTACDDANGKSFTYEQITAEQAKTISPKTTTPVRTKS